MIPNILIPLSEQVQLKKLEEKEDHILLHLISRRKCGLCPNCNQESCQKHSVYGRKFTDLPWAGISVKAKLTLSKYYCPNPNCEPKVFVERLGEQLPPYARRSTRLNKELNKIGYELGGNGGSRLAAFLGIRVSGSSLLRIIHSFSNTQKPVSPRVLGIDDWAFKKGQNYGTLLVDLERRQAIDLLPDREMKTVKEWLEAHLGIEIISRDRAISYAQAATLGAPQAVQVVDRWHLLKNLGDALRKSMDKYQKVIRRVTKELAEIKHEVLNQEPRLAYQPDSPKQKSSISKYELMFREVKHLQAQGHSIRAVHRLTGLHRNTVKKYFECIQYPERVPSKKKNLVISSFEPYLKQRWAEGMRNSKVLWEEIQAKGFIGSRRMVQRFLSKLPKDQKTKQPSSLLCFKGVSTRKLSLLLSQPKQKLDQ